MPNRIAIIGAGVSGLAAAFRLSETDAEITLFEKSKGVSGRAASRLRNECRYDHGANYFKLNCNEVARLLFEELPTDQLCRVLGDIWTFDQDDRIVPGDPVQNMGAKWSYRGGISTLGKLMVEIGDLRVVRERRITGFARLDGGWQLRDAHGTLPDLYDAILLTPPVPQTVDLIEQSDFDEVIADHLCSELSRAEFHPQFTVILNFKGTFSFPGDAYALINSDRRHEIAWLSHENRKVDRIPEGETVLIAQMAPGWTKEHWSAPQEVIIETSLEAVRRLLRIDLPDLQWADTQRWRYAHPKTAASLEAMKPGAEIGLFFAGDGFIGKGRVPRAIETG
ncbi:MAG: FAD-dependent oxidoreductase, partial [Verrucomicrobiota bacterium]